MLRRVHAILSSTLWILLLLATGSPRHTFAQASPSQPVKIRLGVTDAGIACLDGCDAVHVGDNGWVYTVEVEQGALVELSFVWEHQNCLLDEHIIVLNGYTLEWDKISSDNREAMLQFIADKPGAFDFKCDLECEIHDFMQSGTLKVKRSGGDGAAAFTPTILEVSPSTLATGGEPVTLMAILKDAAGGVPVAKAEIHFYLDADFAGVHDKMAIGRAKTDINGIAFFDFQPTLSVQEHRITARFFGAGIYDESENTLTIQETGVPPAAYVIDPGGLPGIRHWAPLILAGIVLGIWVVFGYVLLQVHAIWRDRARAEDPSPEQSG
jgi:hypothetical protein